MRKSRGEERERTRAKREAAKAAKPDFVEPADDGYEEAEDWKALLLGVLGAMKPDAFERLSQRNRSIQAVIHGLGQMV